jgi:hypothetical protein
MSRSSHRRTLRQMGSRRGDVVSRDQRNRSCVMYGVGRRQAPYRAARASRAPRRSQLLGRATHGPAPGRLADRDPATSSRTRSQYGRAPAARRSAGARRRPSSTNPCSPRSSPRWMTSALRAIRSLRVSGSHVAKHLAYSTRAGARRRPALPLDSSALRPITELPVAVRPGISPHLRRPGNASAPSAFRPSP